MGTRRSVRVLLAVVLILVPVLVGVLAGANTESVAAEGDAIITPSAGFGGAISPDTQQTVSTNTSLTFTIAPALGYDIADVVLDGTTSLGAVTSYTFDNVNGVLAGTHTIDATFALQTFTITPTAGAGGTITPSGAQTVNSGGSQTFTIAPNSGYHIVNVVADSTSLGAVTSHTFSSVTANHTISATFAIDTYTITPTAGAGGTITPSGAQTVNSGGSQTFTIAPNSGYHIVNVVADSTSLGAVTSHTFSSVTANHTISATFAIDTYTITPTAGAGGTITPSGAQTVNSGGSQTFTIAPNSGYHIVNVVADSTSLGAVTSHTFSSVTANHTISATFAIDTYTITPTAGAGGTITPSGAQTVNSGGSQTFTIAPNSGYHIVNVVADSTSLGAVTSHTFSSVTANHTISATFAIDTFTITPSAGAHGSISPATAQLVDYGGSRAFTFTPGTGYHVADVLVDGVTVGAPASYTFANVTAKHTISVTFAVNTFTITPSVDAGAHGTISPSTPQTVDYGSNQPFSIKAAGGYYVADVTVDGASVGPKTTHTFVGVVADHTISATFAPGIQTQLWFRFAKNVVNYKSSTLLQGELSYTPVGKTSPVGLGGQLVTVQYASSAMGPWEFLGTCTTSSSDATLGQFSLRITPEAPTWYRLQYKAEPLSEFGSLGTDNKKVGVRPNLGRPVTTTSVRAGRYFIVYGSLKPHFAAGEKTVKIKVYRFRNGRWVYVKALSATNIDSGSITKYRIRTRLTTRGKYRFRATSTAPGWAVATTTYSRTLVVK